MYQLSSNFIDLCIKKNALQFGDFTLKSGRKSPYFYNFGLFDDGESITELGKLYAQKIVEANINFDILFGPAYKGIPLVVATVIALREQYSINKPFCFNRKLIKQHGEKGELIGANLSGNILILDDVITAGTAILESIKLIESYNASVCGAITSLDRQEVAKNSTLSAIENLKQKFNLEVLSLARLDDILNYIKHKSNTNIKHYLPKILSYQNKYCSKLEVV